MPRWPALVWMVAGQAIVAALFPLFTVLRIGPTSYNEEGRWLGVDGQMGALIDGVPSLLDRGRTDRRSWLGGCRRGRASGRDGYVLVLVALIVPAVVDLRLSERSAGRS